MPTSPERQPAEPDEAEQARRVRRYSAYAQAGGAAFLAVVSLGLLPTIIASSFPALGAKAAVVVWVLAPAIPIALLIVAAFRFPRR